MFRHLYSILGVVISPQRGSYPELISDRLRLVLTLRGTTYDVYFYTGIGYSDVDIFEKMKEAHGEVKEGI